MIVNELKEKLPEDWREKFVHRDLWDPDGYGVASFDLGGEREKVLVINFETEDIMEYFYDDRPDDEWISLDFALSSARGSLTGSGQINSNYIYRKPNGRQASLFEKNYKNKEYPTISILGNQVFVHKLVARVFIPNPYPENFTIINHKNNNRRDFHKENLEWCDYRWNSLPRNKSGKYHFDALYKRDDGVILSRKQVSELYGVNDPSVDRSIRESKTYKGHMWERYDPILEDYLSRHPLQDDWYQHPTMPNVRANGCGVLEIDGKLRIGTKKDYERGKGYYKVSIGGRNGKIYYTHRLLAECYFNKLIPENMVVDHIISTSTGDTDNSIRNLRITTYKENSKNCSRVETEVSIYDLFGNRVKRYSKISNLISDIGPLAECTSSKLTISGKFIRLESNGILPNESKKFNYIYYKWSLIDGKPNCVGASTFISYLLDCADSKKASRVATDIRKKYLNTGMPAPDGFYYQQGDPWNMIYDPHNKDLVKKRPEIDWLPRNKRGRGKAIN